MAAVYDELAFIYDNWAAADPAAKSSADFYIRLGLAQSGEIVELGIGTGRIALKLAAKGKRITGIDISDEMLSACRYKAQQLYVDDVIRLMKSDIRDFDLPLPVSLIYLPFRTIGHLLNHQDKLDLFKSVYRNLEWGGRFIFDHYMFSEQWARKNEGKSHFMYSLPYNESQCIEVYDKYSYNFLSQSLNCVVQIKIIDKDKALIEERHITFDFSWITINQIKELSENVGFVVEELLGDFDGTSWSDHSENQIWVLRKEKK